MGCSFRCSSPCASTRPPAVGERVDCVHIAWPTLTEARPEACSPSILAFHKYQEVVTRMALLKDAVRALDVGEYSQLATQIEKSLQYTPCIICYAPDFIFERPGITCGSTSQHESSPDVDIAEHDPTTTASEPSHPPSSKILRSHDIPCSLIFNDDSMSCCQRCSQSPGHTCRQLCKGHRKSLIDFCYNQDGTKRTSEEVWHLLGEQMSCENCAYRPSDKVPQANHDQEGSNGSS